MERYEISNEDWQLREVYAAFGVAAYMAQVLETGLVSYLVVLRADRHKRRKPFNADDAFEKLFRQPLGTNAGYVRDILGEQSPLEDVLAEALTTRNELIHHFWRRRIFQMGSESGREELHSELSQIATRFQEIDAEIQAHTSSLALKYGLTPEVLQKMFEEFEAAARGNRPLPPDWTAY